MLNYQRGRDSFNGNKQNIWAATSRVSMQWGLAAGLMLVAIFVGAETYYWTSSGFGSFSYSTSGGVVSQAPAPK